MEYFQVFGGRDFGFWVRYVSGYVVDRYVLLSCRSSCCENFTSKEPCHEDHSTEPHTKFVGTFFVRRIFTP